MYKQILKITKEIMPAVVSFAALIIAYNSYVISQNQLSVSTIGVEPHFYVDEVPLYDEQTKFWYERELNIFNIGAPVANINTTVKTFYKINDYGEYGEKWIPVSGYYFMSFKTGEPKGKLSTHKGHNNATNDYNATFIQFRDKNADYIDIELMHIVFVSYRSFDGTKKNVCFLNEKLIDCDVANKYHQNIQGKPIEIEGLTYKKLIARYEEYKI